MATTEGEPVRRNVRSPAPKRVLGLVADDQDDVVRIADRVLDMVQDTSRLQHSAGGDHQERPLPDVEFLALLNAVHVVQKLEAEGIAGVPRDEEDDADEPYQYCDGHSDAKSAPPTNKSQALNHSREERREHYATDCEHRYLPPEVNKDSRPTGCR